MKKYIASAYPRREFLLPVHIDGQWHLLGEKSGKPHQTGLVVYVGIDISADDVYAKLESAQFNIQAPEQTRQTIAALLTAIQSIKIGSHVALAPDGALYAV